MNHSQRKRHLYTWVLLAFLLPMGFAFSLWARPDASISKAHKFFQPPALPNVIFSTEDGDISLNLRSSASTLPPSQLEIQIKRELRAPALGVYLANSSEVENVDGLSLIGQISSQGTYRFDIIPESANMSTMSTLVLFDPLHQSIYKIISLKP